MIQGEARDLFYFVTEERNIVLMCRGKGAGTKGEAENTERGKILGLD